MTDFSVEHVRRMGTAELINDPVLNSWVEETFGRKMNGKISKRERGDGGEFMRLWFRLKEVVDQKISVREDIETNWINGRITVLGLDNMFATEALTQSIRKWAQEGGIGGIQIRGLAEHTKFRGETTKTMIVIREQLR